MNRLEIEKKTRVNKAILLEEIDSTNDAAKRALQNGEQPPFLYCAERQTSGKGRDGRRWVDWSGALLFSLAARWSNFHLTRRESAILSQFVGEMVAETTRETIARELGVARNEALDARTTVKKPNDVLCDGKKLSGILIESPNSEYVVVGIGVNIANEAREAPQDWDRERAVSIVDAISSVRSDLRESLLARTEELRERFLIELVLRLLKSEK